MFLKIFFIFLLYIAACNCVKEEFTTKGKPCMSSCVHYSNYDFCYTGWGTQNWDYCNPKSGPNELIYFTSKAGVMCTSHCGRFGYGYDWCFTGAKGANEKCSTQFGYTSDGRKCIDKCKLYGDTYKCYFKLPEFFGDIDLMMLPSQKLGECSPPPINLNDFKDVKKLINADSCTIRGKRDIENAIRTIGVVALAARMAQLFGEQQVQNYNGVNSVTGYVTLRAPPQQGLQDTELPVVVRASITRQHLVDRSPIPRFVDQQMTNMNRLPSDEQGHLVAASLGGPNLLFNFAPQDPGTNRALRSNSYWFRVEGEMRDFVRGGGRVDLTILLAYDDVTRNRRPVGFGMNAVFYDANGTVDHDSGDCYFTNDPAGGSII